MFDAKLKKDALEKAWPKQMSTRISSISCKIFSQNGLAEPVIT